MSDHQFVVTDIDFQPFKEDSGSIRPLPVKEEVVKDDDILLFADEMDAFNSNQSYEIENMGTQVTIPESSTFHINFTDDQMNQMLNGDSFVKLPTDVSMYKTEEIKNERPLSHLVKYKMQDGKHTKVWQCGVCQKEFGHQYILMRHLPTHTDERKFQCNTCGKAFRQMSTLSQHRAIHSAERPYVCEICQKTFNRVSTLISHRKTHTGLKPHRCHLCNKAFHQKGNLRNHIFTHTNERPYKCDVCSKGFNQMSNLMCHKIKAHQRSDKPRYNCQTCGKDFQKRMSLRNHEQYEHGDVVAGSSNGMSRVNRYSNGVIVEPINTIAMQHALTTNQTPFALLRPLNGIPVLVRVLAAGRKQMLVPATAEDLKKHGQITITPKTEDIKSEDGKEVKEDEKVASIGEIHENGSTVQIRIPVVATVIQRCGKDGNMCMDVESPGPGPDGILNDNFMYTTTTNVANSALNMSDGMFPVPKPIMGISSESMVVGEGKCEEGKIPKIEYLDLSNINDENKNNFFSQNFSYTTVVDGFNNSIQYDTNIIDIQEEAHNDQENNTVHLFSNNDDVFDIQNDSSSRIYQLLDKSSDISLQNSNGVLDTTSFLVDSSLNDQAFTIL